MVERSLTGVWHGLYSYPCKQEPVFFTADITEAVIGLTGFTEERASIGADRVKTIFATLRGRRQGNVVTFRKIYEARNDWYDTVDYEGVVNDEATEIEGRWSVPGSWSGRFLMVRSIGTGVKVVADTFVPA